MLALNAKLKRDSGSKRQNWEEIMALNAELKRDSGSERQTEKIWWLWTPKLRRDNGFEHRNWEEIVALNAKLWMTTLNIVTDKIWQLWTPGCKEIVALNVKLWRTWWGGNMPQCSVSLQLSIRWNGLKETPWVSKDASLMSRTGQIDYKYGLTIHLTKSQDLMMCHNKSNAFNSKCSTGGVHRHLKWMIH